jgi:hypothetical protein
MKKILNILFILFSFAWIGFGNLAYGQTLSCPDSASYSYMPDWNWWSKPTETGYNADDWRPYLADFPVSGSSDLTPNCYFTPNTTFP